MLDLFIWAEASQPISIIQALHSTMLWVEVKPTTATVVDAKGNCSDCAGFGSSS